jgi:hypothetical protein
MLEISFSFLIKFLGFLNNNLYTNDSFKVERVADLTFFMKKAHCINLLNLEKIKFEIKYNFTPTSFKHSSQTNS